MAAPHVAGLALLLCKEISNANSSLFSNPEFNRNTYVKNVLMNSAIDMNFDSNIQGAGLVNYEKAIEIIRNGENPPPKKLPASRYSSTYPYSLDSKFTIKEFVDIIPYTKQKQESITAIQSLAKDLTTIRTKFSISSLGRNSTKLLNAVTINPTNNGFFTFRYFANLNLLYNEMSLLHKLEIKYFEQSPKNKTLKNEIKKSIESIKRINGLERTDLVTY